MINIKELRGTSLKRDLGLERVIKRWHNKNKSGGNFGINLMTKQRPHYEITGYHDTQGNVTSLSFGELYQAGTTIFRRDECHKWNYQMLVKLLKRALHENKKTHGWTENIYKVQSFGRL